jgi:hypothetical protein
VSTREADTEEAAESTDVNFSVGDPAHRGTRRDHVDHPYSWGGRRKDLILQAPVIALMLSVLGLRPVALRTGLRWLVSMSSGDRARGVGCAIHPANDRGAGDPCVRS